MLNRLLEYLYDLLMSYEPTGQFDFWYGQYLALNGPGIDTCTAETISQDASVYQWVITFWLNTLSWLVAGGEWTHFALPCING